MANHLIVRQTFDLSVTSSDKKRNVMEEISRMNKELILPLTERVLDSFGGGEAHLRFDKIEIDLGTVSPEEFIREFEHKLHDQLQRQLPGSHFSPGKAPHMPNGLPDARETSSSETRPGQEKTAHEALGETSLENFVFRYLETLVYFLQTGRLPWWIHGDEKDIIAPFEKALRERPDEVITTLQKAWNSHTERRFYAQFPEIFIRLLFDEIGVKYLDIRHVKGEMNKHHLHVVPSSISWHQVEKAVISSVMENAARQEKPEELYLEISRKLAKVWPSGNSSFARQLPALLNYLGAKSHTIDGITRYFGSDTQKNLIKHLSTEKHQEVPYPTVNKEDNANSPPDPEETGQLDKKETIPEELPEEGIFIGNAGAVILWPFLREFFESQNLIDKTSFRDEGCREKAVLWLQHIATGEHSFPEYDLSLNKILCGWPLEETLSSHLNLREIEMLKTEEMLENVIEQWKAIGKVSVPGFRESFLLRDGLLKKNDFGWQLKVERKPYDLLLDRLPWSFGLIKFKWMNQPLFVEW